jgi:hypothetical protein
VPAGRNWNYLSYKIRAKVKVGEEYEYSEWKIVTQDEIDMLRQQYIDMSKNTVPARNEFINEGSTAHFNLDEGACNCGNHTYHLWSIMNRLEQVRTALHHSMTVNSGYRCPIHNSNIGGAANSRHIYGDAADIAVEDFNNDGSANQDDWDTLAQIAQTNINNSGNTGYVEPYDRTGTWVHMDWRP